MADKQEAAVATVQAQAERLGNMVVEGMRRRGLGLAALPCRRFRAMIFPGRAELKRGGAVVASLARVDARKYAAMKGPGSGS